jgi:ankyrin repeat protein
MKEETMNNKTTRIGINHYILGVMILLNFSIHTYAETDSLKVIQEMQQDRFLKTLSDQPYSAIKELIDQGAIVRNYHLNAVLSSNNRDKYRIAELLIKNGADINDGVGVDTEQLNDIKFRQFLTDNGFRYSEAVDPQTGKSLLHTAIEFYMSHDGIECDQIFNVLKFLLQHGTKINAVDKEMKTPLHCVCFLLPDIWQDGRGISPGYIKGMAILECLVKNGAKINAQDAEGNTPFHLTERKELDLAKKSCRTAEVMMELGADPFLKNTKGDSPFTLALETHRNAAAVMVACMNAAQKKQYEKEFDRFIKAEQEKALIRRDNPDSVLTEKQLNEIVERYLAIKKLRKETPTVNPLSREAYLSLWTKNYLKAENYEMAQKYAELIGKDGLIKDINHQIAQKNNMQNLDQTPEVTSQPAAEGIKVTDEELATVLNEYRKEVIPIMVDIAANYLKMRDIESYNKHNSDAYPNIYKIEDHLRNQVQKAKPKTKKSNGWDGPGEISRKFAEQKLSAGELREKNTLKTQISSQIRKYRTIQGKLLTYLKRLKVDDVEKVYIQVVVEQERLMPQAEKLKSFYTYYVEEDLADQILQLVEGKNYSSRVRLADD